MQPLTRPNISSSRYCVPTIILHINPLQHIQCTVARSPNFLISLTFSVERLTFKDLQDQNIAFNVYRLSFSV